MLWNQLRHAHSHNLFRQLEKSCCQHHAKSKTLRRMTGTFVAQSDLKEPVRNKLCPYTIEEITIPIPSVDESAFLAGQIWRGESNPSEKMLPPIICAHGLLDNAGSYAALLPLVMKSNMTALCVDFPGHGLSSHLASGHYDHVIDNCRSLYRVYKYMNTSKVILIGHSMSALSSFLFAAMYPEYVEGLISIDAHAFTTQQTLNRLKFMVDRQMAVEDKLAQSKPIKSFTYEEILEKFYLGRVKEITLAGCKQLLKRGSKQLPDGKYVLSYDPRAYVPCSVGRFSIAELREICASIKCPVTVIKVAKPPTTSGIKTTYDYTEDYEEVIKCLKKTNNNVQVHFVPGNHFVHINEPNVVAPIVRASLGF